MALVLGRLGLATASGGDGYTVDDPRTITAQGDTLQLSGLHANATAADVMWLRDQILLLPDPDRSELVVPIRFGHTQLDGWYEVLDASVTDPESAVGGSISWFEWAVDLRRIREWRLPRHDVHAVGGVLTNGHSITTGTIATYAPPSIDDWSPDFNATRTTRASSDGTINVAYVTGAGSLSPFIGTFIEQSPSVHYLGGCRVSGRPGASDRIAVGRYSFPDEANVLLSNGVVRCQWVSAGAALQVEWWDPTSSAWESATSFTLSGRATHGTLTAKSASIRRNGPEQVTVRFVCTPGNGLQWGRVFVDVTIRRGSRTVICWVSGTAQSQWQLQFTTSTACTSVTGALHRTSGDGNGHRPIIMGPDAGTAGGTRDTTIGAIWQSAATNNTCLFGIGCNVNASGSAPDSVTEQVAEFFWQLAETQRTVTV